MKTFIKQDSKFFIQKKNQKEEEKKKDLFDNILQNKKRVFENNFQLFVKVKLCLRIQIWKNIVI